MFSIFLGNTKQFVQGQYGLKNGEDKKSQWNLLGNIMLTLIDVFTQKCQKSIQNKHCKINNRLTLKFIS